MEGVDRQIFSRPPLLQAYSVHSDYGYCDCPKGEEDPQVLPAQSPGGQTTAHRLCSRPKHLTEGSWATSVPQELGCVMAACQGISFQSGR